MKLLEHQIGSAKKFVSFKLKKRPTAMQRVELHDWLMSWGRSCTIASILAIEMGLGTCVPAHERAAGQSLLQGVWREG